jgi:uncharacterized protein
MKNIKNLFVLFGTLLLSQFLMAQTPPSVSEGTAESKNSLLWEVTGKDLKKPSYVFGTIHMIPKADFYLSEKAKKAISESDKVVFEINMKDMQNPMKLFGLLSKMLMADNKKLKDLVSPEDYKLIKDKFEETGLPLGMLERVKPMFLSMMLEGGGEGGNPMDSKSNSKNTAYEIEIMKLADKDEKEQGGLETIEFQMSIFDSIPNKVQAEMLVKSVKSKHESGESEFKKLVDMYKSENIEAMAASIKSESTDDTSDEAGRFEKLLLINRNKNWIPKMAKMMGQQTTFFAVGAGHLGGELGVVNLLKQEGYTLKPLK